MTILYVVLKAFLIGKTLLAPFDALKGCSMCFELMREPRVARIIKPIGSWAFFKCTTIWVQILVNMASKVV